MNDEESCRQKRTKSKDDRDQFVRHQSTSPGRHTAYSKGANTTETVNTGAKEPGRISTSGTIDAGGKEPERFFAYVMCVKTDIIHLVQTHEADFTSEINEKIGPVNNRFCNGCVRIDCKSATQLDALLAIKEFLHEAVTVTRPWTGSDKALEKAREADNK